ncbi:hypothetical protein UFOVP139_54 [uncultured Caudovirales phage]|uniref:Uncharacterized protein n=1 Tax=uncultured Caudovirales phage TaxID=2100421 RepID=A0A6J5LKU9_9CAUD|nr:hypothetical protein UFOVP139_54 [uncultured Caudovirales phage]
MSLDKYKLPLCMVDGVEFALDDAPEVKVTVRMPIQANKKFSFGWARRLPIKDGVLEASPFDVVAAQKVEFFETQIVKIEGVDKPETFWKDYPLALEEIWEKVQAALPEYQDQLEEEAKN